MRMPLRVLMAEDSEDDAALVVLALRRGGYEPTLERVETAEAMEEALTRPHDIVIADFAMPHFSGLAALDLVRQRGLDLPFLLVSGTIGEETAVAAMKAGAHDYILKQHLARLVPAVSRELRDAEARRERQRAETSLRLLEESSVTLAESLDYMTTLTKVSRLAVPFLADWCTVDLVQDDGSLRRAAMAHADKEREGLLRELECFPSAFARVVLSSGKPELFPNVPEPLLVERCPDAAHRRLLQALGTETIMAVPLVAREEIIGVITLGSPAPRSYGAIDLRLAEEMARRAALAIDNSRLYHEAQEAFREAQEAIRARDEFFLIASHELRTPLTPLLLQIQSALRFASRGDGASTSTFVTTQLESAARQIIRVAKLVDTLLDISRITTADDLRFQVATFDLAALLREVAGRYDEELKRARSTLALHADVPVTGAWDRMRMDQVISNLLSNAVKYGAGSPIEASVTADNGVASLVVRDHGIGIAPKDVSRIFGRFERAVPVSHYGGFGVGLWLVRKVVDAMGGTIRIESELGKGSTFIVDLPREGGDHQKSGGSTGSSRDPKTLSGGHMHAAAKSTFSTAL